MLGKNQFQKAVERVRNRSLVGPPCLALSPPPDVKETQSPLRQSSISAVSGKVYEEGKALLRIPAFRVPASAGFLGRPKTRLESQAEYSFVQRSNGPVQLYEVKI